MTGSRTNPDARIHELTGDMSRTISESGWYGRSVGLPHGDLNPDAHPYRLRGVGERPGWAHQMVVSDAQIYRGLDVGENLVAAEPWTIIPPMSATPEEERQAAWMASCYDQLDGGFVESTMVRPMSAIPYGFSLSEITADIDDQTGEWGLTGLHWIAPWQVHAWVTKPDGYPLGVLLYEAGQGITVPIPGLVSSGGRHRYIPWEKLYHYAQRFSGRNFEGVGICRPLYYSWQHKTQILVDDADARYRASSGIPYATPPLGADRGSREDEYEEARAIVEAIAEGNHPAYYVAPEAGWDIGVNYLGHLPDNTPMLRYLDHQFASQVADTISDLGQTGYGSRAVGSEMRMERTSVLVGMTTRMLARLQHAVHREIYRLNGWDQRRMCRVVAPGLQEQVLLRRMFEFLSTETPANPLLEVTEEVRDRLMRVLGLGG